MHCKHWLILLSDGGLQADELGFLMSSGVSWLQADELGFLMSSGVSFCMITQGWVAIAAMS